MISSIFLLLLNSLQGGILGTQTDWSGGPGYPGPVEQWSVFFNLQSKIDYSVPGLIAMVPEGEVPSFSSYSPVAENLEQAFSVCTADFDADGSQDMASGSYNGSIFVSLNGNSGEEWTTSSVNDNAPASTFLSSGDFNGDGKPDILTCLYELGDIVWYENGLPADTNWVAHTLPGFSNPYSCVPWDPDQDGDWDILGISYSEDGVFWMENLDGTGLSWSLNPIDQNFQQGRRVAFGDIDNDGDDDVIASGGPLGTITLYTAPGWQEYLIADSTGIIEDIELADFNGDGRIDVGAIAVTSHGAKWYENPEVQGEPWEDRSVGNISGITFKPLDLDQDGDQDIVSSSFENDFVTISINTGGSGQGWQSYNSDIGISAFTDIAVADINGDMIMDIAGASYFGGMSAWCAGSTEITYPTLSTLTSSIMHCDSLSTSGSLYLEVDMLGYVLLRFRSSDDPSSMGAWSNAVLGPVSDVTDLIEPGDTYCQYLITLYALDDFTPAFAYEISLTGEPSGTAPETPPAVRANLARNPCSGSPILSVLLTEYGPLSVSCYDLSGRVVQRIPESEYSPGTHRITLGNFPPGLYIIKVEASGESLTEKLIVTGGR